MGTNAIIAAIDKELARLEKIRSLLVQKQTTGQRGANSGSSTKKGRKSRLSPAARERIAEAQRKRWAAVRNARG